jgi:dethiobiotin synthetase
VPKRRTTSTPSPLSSAPVSPHLAAQSADVTLDLSTIVRWVVEAEASHRHRSCFTLIETAGAVLSPLTQKLTNLNLAQALEPAIWILVAPDSLGVLHDLTATLLAMRTLARPPDFIALSAAREPDASTGTNADQLQHLGIATVHSTLGRDATTGLESLAQALLNLS